MKTVVLDGETISLKAACERVAVVAYTTAYARIKRGWDVLEALTTPAQEQNAVERGNKICSCCKERKSVDEFYVLGRQDKL